ncbi:hypothetical protein ABG067_001729 [Albugo candida]
MVRPSDSHAATDACLIEKSVSSEQALMISHYPCSCHNPTAMEAREFRKRWQLLTESERIQSLSGNYHQFIQTATEILPCLGCRSSTEDLFHRVTSNAAVHALHSQEEMHDACSATSQYCGIVFEEGSRFRLNDGFLNDADATLSLFLHHEHSGSIALARILGSNKVPNAKQRGCSRVRCPLHSQRSKGKPRPAMFEAQWMKLSIEQQRYISKISSDQFLMDLEAYLRRHRFCCRCKEKVLEAYDLLTGTSCSEDECESCAAFDDSQSGYMGSEFSLYHDNQCEEFSGEDLHYTSYLFNEISYSRSKNLLFVPSHLEYMMQLVSRADQELVGDWGDRHARTIAEAQDEVLTCLGMVIWDKLQALWTKIRTDKLSEELLLHCAVMSIRRNFENAVEVLHGHEIMEQLLAEEDDETRRVAEKKEKRKAKKKKRKNAKQKQNERIVPPSSNKTGVKKVVDSSVITTKDMNRSPSSVATTSSFTGSSGSPEDDEDDIVDGVIFNQSSCASKTLELDNQKELQLLSSMGWDVSSTLTFQDHHLTIEEEMDEPSLGISEDEIAFWKKNKSILVSKRLAQRQKLQERFDQFVLNNSL